MIVNLACYGVELMTRGWEKAKWSVGEFRNGVIRLRRMFIDYEVECLS